MTAVGKSNRDSLRNHRRFIHLALQDYIIKIAEILKVQPGKIRILESVESTRIRVPKEILPQEFIDLALEENDNKRYQFKFHQDRAHFIQIILEGKPLITDGQGRLLYFFRELLQYLENKKK